jgi:hypothetical protein
MILQKIGIVLILVASPVTARAQEQQAKRQPGWPCAGTVDRSYALNAEATGGKVLLFRKTELAGVVDDVKASSQHEETVFRASARLTEGTYKFDIPVDSAIESAYFFVSLQCLESVEVVRPSGDALHADSADVDYHRYAAVHMLTVKEPTPGIWKVRITGRGVLSLIVSARTELRLTRVSLLDGGAPVIFAAKRETPLRLEASMMGLADEIAFQFISSSAAPIQAVDLNLEQEADGSRTYAADVMPPVTEVRLAVTGIDPKGCRFQRVQKHLVVGER